MCDTSEQRGPEWPGTGSGRGTLASAAGPAAPVRAGTGSLALYFPFVLADHQGAGLRREGHA